MSEGEKESGFKVVDKRRFTSDGQARADAPPDEPRKPMVVGGGAPQGPARPPQGQGRAPQQPAAQGSDPRRSQPAQRPQEPKSGIDFISFIASLATNAMAAMGALPEAQARGMPVNPQLAREYIEIIAMLQERTHGNLSREEDNALQRLLSDLRLTFVEATQHQGAQPKRPAGR